MNDEWSRCPICFEDYSATHRPTTFECGHSTCIDHVTGRQPLQFCPICRYKLRANYVYSVSYNLQEASHLFQLIKDKIDWSTIQPPHVEVKDAASTSAAELLKRDEVYARQLQAELNRETPRRQPTAAAQSTAAPVVQNRPHPPNNPVTNNNNPTRPIPQGPQTNMKTCGHACDLRTTAQCCACSDRRPNASGQRYPVYADGHRMLSTDRRDEWYCPACKRH